MKKIVKRVECGHKLATLRHKIPQVMKAAPKKDDVLRLRIPADEKQMAESKALELGISTSALARIALKLALASAPLALPRLNG